MREPYDNWPKLCAPAVPFCRRRHRGAGESDLGAVCRDHGADDGSHGGPAGRGGARRTARRPMRVLDIAAGHGLFGIEIAKQNPQARITGLDWAPVLRVALDNARKAGVHDRYDDAARQRLRCGFRRAVRRRAADQFSAPLRQADLRGPAEKGARRAASGWALWRRWNLCPTKTASRRRCPRPSP